jgi:TBC1 domain family protein 5
MGWDVRRGPFTGDRSLDLCGHAHSDTESMYVICAIVGTNSQIAVIPSDYSGQLTYLLRYSSNFSSESMPSTAPHHTALLLRQALTLQMSPTPGTGSSIVIENRNLLNLPVEVPESPPQLSRRRGGRSSGRRKSVSETRSTPLESGHSSRGSIGRAANGQLNLPDFAKGLLDRGEALGINKTFMNAVSEIKVRLVRLFNTAVDDSPTLVEEST